MDSLVQTFSDLCAAHTIGYRLSTPSDHFVRVLKLFNQEERGALLKKTYQSMRASSLRDFSLDQFISWALFAFEPLSNIPDFNDDTYFSAQIGIDSLGAVEPHQIRVSELGASALAFIARARAGEHPAALARIITRSTFGETFTAEIAALRELTETFSGRITRPEQAAAISQCLYFNQKLAATFIENAKELIDYANIIAEQDLGTADKSLKPFEPRLIEHDEHAFIDRLKSVKAILDDGWLLEAIAVNDSLRFNLDLPGRFDFLETKYGVLVPSRTSSRLNSDFRTLVERARLDKSTLLSLSPRQFETFMANLFRELGYEVELTKATRDGGADLICVRARHGIPFRFAVELKRYKEGNPVSVELVRSFVGANRQFNADKLVYVTTSSYTKAAVDWADSFAPHLLTLKDYSQVREWCEDVGQQTWRLLD